MFLNALWLKRICDEAVNRWFFVFLDSDWCKTQKLYDRVVSEDPFLIVYSPDKQKTQKMCNKAVDCSLAALKFIPDWFGTRKMIKELFTAFYADENILYFN